MGSGARRYRNIYLSVLVRYQNEPEVREFLSGCSQSSRAACCSGFSAKRLRHIYCGHSCVITSKNIGSQGLRQFTGYGRCTAERDEQASAKAEKAGRAKLQRQAGQSDIISTVNLAGLATAMRKVATAASSNIGLTRAAIHAAIVQAILADYQVESKLVVGYAAWRTGDGRSGCYNPCGNKRLNMPQEG